MNGDRDPLLHWGSGIVALGALGMLAAAAAILPRQIDPGARVGRHLLAGGLSIAALSIVNLLVALFALRRGEKWAFWAAAVPVVLVGVPVVIVDATYVAPPTLFATILPQVFGLAITLVGLTLCGLSLFRPSVPAPPQPPPPAP